MSIINDTFDKNVYEIINGYFVDFTNFVYNINEYYSISSVNFINLIFNIHDINSNNNASFINEDSSIFYISFINPVFSVNFVANGNYINPFNFPSLSNSHSNGRLEYIYFRFHNVHPKSEREVQFECNESFNILPFFSFNLYI